MLRSACRKMIQVAAERGDVQWVMLYLGNPVGSALHLSEKRWCVLTEGAPRRPDMQH